MHNSIRLVFLAVGIGFLACGPSGPSEAVGSSAAAIHGGSNDPNDVNANVVVEIQDAAQTGWGGGILVAPLLVLTANHVIWGSTSEPAHTGNTPVIRLQVPGTMGNNVVLPVSASKVPAVHTTGYINPNNDSDVAQDFALIYLDPKALDANVTSTRLVPNQQPIWPVLIGTHIERPSLSVPSNTNQNGFYTFTPPISFAGWAASSQRQVATTTTGSYQLVTAPTGAYWFLNSATGIDGGDSGGALFVTRPDPDDSRDPFGVVSAEVNTGGIPTGSKFADLTNSTAVSWLVGHAVDAPANHTSTWNAKHPPPAGHTDRWYGETDYAGPCQAGDADCDGWYDQHDNCPNVFNPSQIDSDDDGYGDACPCPCDQAAGYADYDGDGVCAVACSWQKADNCPKAYNPDQANCNADAEQAHNQTLLGDACDPVPCPASNANVTSHDATSCTGSVVLGGSCIGRKVHNEIDTMGIAAHGATYDSTKPVDPGCSQGSNIKFTYVANVSSEMRFCESNIGAGYKCHDPANINDGHLVDLEPSPPDSSVVWHRVTQGTCSGNCYSTLVDDPRAQTYAFDYDDAFKSVKGWDYLSDNAYWTTSNVIPLPDNYSGCSSSSYGSGTCLDGTWWSHADTPVGNSTTPTAPNGCYVGSHGDQLANHYFDLRPDAIFSWSYAGLGLWRQILLWRTLPDPWETGSIPETRFVVSNGSGSQLGVLHDDGTSAQIPSDGPSAIVSHTLQVALGAPGTVWANAVEPSPNIGMVDSRVEAVALSSDGRSMLNIALNDNGTLRARSELGFPDFVSRDTASHPAPRNNPIALYSSSAGGVFMLGGSDPTSGAPMHDIWFRQMNNDWGPVVASGYSPDTVLAATFSFADQQLYVLEHTPTPTDTVRLVRIDYRTGNAQTLGTCSRGPTYPTSYLTVDNDGSILVTSTNASSSVVGHLEVDNNGSAYLSQLDTSEGGLVVAPIVDPNGYSFLTQYAPPGTQQFGYLTNRRTTPNYGAPGSYDLCQMFPQPIANGGFESGTLASWTATGQLETASTAAAHSGSYGAMLGSTSATNGDSTIQQMFTVPPAGGTLSFSWSNTCPDSVSYDWFTATLQNPSGGTLATIVPNTCVASSAWTQASLNLAPWAGQSVVLVLTNHDDNFASDPTYSFVDDVSVSLPQPIANGGFESGALTSWTASGQSETVSTASPHWGTYSAMLGSTSPTNGDSTITQTFTAPPGGGTLSFWYSNVCPDSVTFDWFTATLQNPSGGTLAAIVSNTCAVSSAWTQASLNLAPWAGQSVVLVLTSHDDNYPGDATYSFVDDVGVY